MFKKLGALFVVCVLTALPAFAAETYQIDKNHSEIGFQIRHVLTKVRGAFTDFEGTIRLDRETPENSSVNVTIQAASIDTNNPRRDQDLQSDNFFDVENYPEITFESSKVVKTGENTYDVTGTFTMHGVSKEITLPATFLGTMKDARGTTKAGFEASTTIDRKHWGIVYNRAVEGGGLLLGDDVEIDINIEANEASTVSGQPGGGQDRAARGGGGGGPGGGGFLAQFDADGDGKISKEEAPERMQERFDTMDANGDGFIDQEEMQAMRQRFRGRGGPGRGGPGGPGGGGFLARFDADGDGKISKEEAPERMQERFDTMDANGDGFIDQEEMQAMRQRLGGRGGPGGGRRPPQ